jgi:hypothetical protein
VIHLGFRGSDLLPLRNHVLCCCPLEFSTCCVSFLWLDLRSSSYFILYIVYFTFSLYFLHTHLSHFGSHVILACICLIMFITVL